MFLQTRSAGGYLPRHVPALAPARFAEHFREHVMPDLVRLCRLRGLFVALDIERFDEAWLRVMRTAVARGANHLPPATLEELDGWISTSLAEVAASHEPAVAAQRLLADRIGDELDAYMARWVAQTDAAR